MLFYIDQIIFMKILECGLLSCFEIHENRHILPCLLTYSEIIYRFQFWSYHVVFPKQYETFSPVHYIGASQLTCSKGVPWCTTWKEIRLLHNKMIQNRAACRKRWPALKTVVLNLFDVFENLISLKTAKKSVQKICQKICQKFCQKICQKIFQKICQKIY